MGRDAMMDEAALAARLARATRTVDRVQAQPAYDVGSDLDNYRRYVHGEPGPDMAAIEEFHAWLDAGRARGITWRQLLIPPMPLNAYWRYACEWGFAYHTAHEDIRILVPVLGSVPPFLGFDFYIIDGRDVVMLDYDTHCRFTGAWDCVPAGAEVAAWDAAWDRAVPFAGWWAAHPEYKRKKVSVA